MSATLDYDLKKTMKVLSKDWRWNVLTTLILHANLRNRCWVGMDTIAEMATNGNLTKATRAKKWLEQHGAFELVPYEKRVDEETECSARQHVYQLTGRLKACSDLACECQSILAEPMNYLHYAKPPVEAKKSNVLDGQNIAPSEVLDGKNFNHGKVLNGNVFNGQNGSISNIEVSTTTTESVSTKVIPLTPPVVVGGDETPVELSADAQKVFKAYEANIGLITPMIADEIKSALKEYPAEWIVEGMSIAVTQNARKWSYVRGVLQRWKREGKQDRAAPSGKSPLAGLKLIVADEEIA